MRVRKQINGITINAVAGCYVIFFGLDLAPEQRPGFRGFAFRREDHSNGEITWLRGIKTFEATEPRPAPGENFSTQLHPVQSFQWADYSVFPGNRYTYTIQCMYGMPENLLTKGAILIEITAESENDGTHAAFFNRGSVATQEYARRFLNRPPNIAGPAAYKWLSRGLVEAMISFIARAKSGYSIHGAVYELQWPEVLAALKKAKQRKAVVKVIFDDVQKADGAAAPIGPWQLNEAAIEAARIKSLTKPRRNAKLMHNKFFVLSKGDRPVAVWTGSTNLTENGLYGHANVGHIIEDSAVAAAFKNYYDRLYDDLPIDKAYRDANMMASPVPAAIPTGTTAIFSPRGTSLDSLEWFAALAGGASDALLMTFAFGMHEKFKEVYRRNDHTLRMSLMEKAYASPSVKQRDERDIRDIRNRPNVVVAIGNRIVTNSFDRWLKEMNSVDGKGKHVYWVHTKFMLVDPLGASPIVVTGSANFSKASTDTNDENMIVIKDDKRIADIYFGEYMRLYTHYAFREAVKFAMDKSKTGTPENWTPQFLATSDRWMKDYFSSTDRTARFARRIYFSGPMSI